MSNLGPRKLFEKISHALINTIKQKTKLSWGSIKAHQNYCNFDDEVIIIPRYNRFLTLSQSLKFKGSDYYQSMASWFFVDSRWHSTLYAVKLNEQPGNICKIIMPLRLLVVCWTLLLAVRAQINQAPTWTSSSLIEANSAMLINTGAVNQKTGNSTTIPNTIVTFTNTYTVFPNLGFGMGQYDADDSLYSEMFEINKIAQTLTSFTIKVTVTGFTNIWFMELRYIAIDKSFPHHLNTFDNVPINYSKPALTNISNQTTFVQTYTNVVNYTLQAIAQASTYTKFSMPLTNNKIVLFMTSLFVSGNLDSSPPYYPMDLRVTAVPSSETTYDFTARFVNGSITRLHFSMVIFDIVDVQSSGKYMLAYGEVNFTASGGSIPVLDVFKNNFLMSLTDFSTTRTTTAIVYDLNFGPDMITMPVSVCRNTSYTVASRYGLSYFYLKTWVCPNTTYYNQTTGNCTSCPISQCLQCLNSTFCLDCNLTNSYYKSPLGVCLLCDSATNNFINMTSKQCQACTLPGCLACLSLTQCQTCNYSANYIRLGNGTCSLCSGANMFANSVTNMCEVCLLDNCTLCSSASTCIQCDAANAFYLLGNATCAYCDPALQLFINFTSFACDPCAIPECLTCTSLSVCSVCNTTNAFFFNVTSGKCSPCSLNQCLQCQDLSRCLTCNQTADYFLSPLNSTCIACSLAGCLNCTSPTECSECDLANNYGPSFMTPNQTQCGLCQVNCLCGGYALPWDPVRQTCMGLCGDGQTKVDEECDDGNLVSGDGCSAGCRVEAYWYCLGQPSICDQTLYIEAELVTIDRDGCNSVKITTKVKQFSLAQISENILILNEGLHFTKALQEGGLIIIYASYSRDIANEQIQVHFSPGTLLTIPYSPTLPALYYEPDECDTSASMKDMFSIVEIISYVVLGISILSCKIVGLELFGVLQLAYFVLNEHQFLNVYLLALTNFKSFNGFNLPLTGEDTEALPPITREMGLAPSFLNNCNVMLLATLAELLIAAVILLIGRLTHGDRLKKIGLRMLKQVFTTFILFNAYNVAFSAGLHWKYADQSADFYLLSTAVMVGAVVLILCTAVAMEFSSAEGYGQFKQKFKKQWSCQAYIPITIAYRLVVGFCVGSADSNQSPMLLLGASLVFLLYCLVNTPFLNVYQNYRAALCHVTSTAILLAATYYRTMRSNTMLAVKAKIHLPALMELVLIVACLCFSFIVLMYEIVMLVRDWRRDSRKTQNEMLHTSEDDLSMANVNK